MRCTPETAAPLGCPALLPGAHRAGRGRTPPQRPGRAGTGQEARRATGVVPQFDNLDPDFTVENLLVFGRYFGLEDRLIRSRIPDLLEFAGLGLDVRGHDEFKENQLGRGETLIPLGQLRGRVSELPKDKNATILSFCKVSMRGYEAQRILNAGYTDVRIMEGGLMAISATNGIVSHSL